MSGEFRHSIFALAHTDVTRAPFGNAGRTLRLVVETNTPAKALTIKFSNRCGEEPLVVGAASLARCNATGVLRPDTLSPLTVNGVLSFELAPGEDILSDTLRFSLAPGDFFALNLYYPPGGRVGSGNWASNHAQRSRPGNYSADLHLHPPGLVSRFARTVIPSDVTVQVTTVAEIIADCEAPHRVVACFGDSITQQGNWTVPFTKRLFRAFPGEVSLCNLGISGNRLLGPSPPALGGVNGDAGIARFEHDVLGLHGLTHAILALGTNDIGLPGTGGLTEDDMITLPQYVEAMTELAACLHQRGVKVYAATLCPRPMVRPYNFEREGLRHMMNAWIRTAKCFDAVLDFDKVLRRDDGQPGMRDGCSLPDRLHPSPYGGLWMAKSIELSLFGGDG